MDKKIYPAGARYLPQLRVCHQFDHARCPQCRRIWAGISYEINSGKCGSVFGLCSIIRTSRTYLWSVQYGFRRPQRRLLTQQTQGTKPCWWNFFHFGRCLFSPQQWSCAQPSTDHENSNVLSRGSINWSNVRQFTQTHPISKNNLWNGPPPTLNPNSDRKFCYPFRRDQQWAAEARKIDGHAFLLATFPRHAGSIPILLEARQPELGWVLDQAFPRLSPHKHAPRIIDTCTSSWKFSRDVKLGQSVQSKFPK